MLCCTCTSLELTLSSHQRIYGPRAFHIPNYNHLETEDEVVNKNLLMRYDGPWSIVSFRTKKYS
jgi:hypothetical protein